MQLSPFDPFFTPTWLKPRQRDRTLRIPARLMWGILVSLLIHAILFWGFIVKVLNPGGESASVPLNVVLDLGLPVPKVTEKAQEPPPPSPVQEPPKPKVKPQPPQPRQKQLPLPKVIQSDNRNSALKVPVEPQETVKQQEPAPTAPPKPPVEDFSSMIKRKQSQNYATEMAAKRINDEAAAAERGPTEDERRMKNIMNNLKTGTNGLFTIRRMDPLNASFSFKGWTNDYASANTQYFEVEAKPGEDIRLVMIRRMISLIREHYSGDFDWVSYRLNRTVSLSARPADSAGLADFMMREFFGPNYKNQDLNGN